MALNTEVKARELAVNTSKLRSDCDSVATELDRVLNLAKEMVEFRNLIKTNRLSKDEISLWYAFFFV